MRAWARHASDAEAGRAIGECARTIKRTREDYAVPLLQHPSSTPPDQRHPLFPPPDVAENHTDD